MSFRYKSKPITPVDAVRWNGDNLADMQSLCPEARVMDPTVPWIISIPVEGGTTAVLTSEYVMKNVGTGFYSKLSEDVFLGLYTPQ